MAASDRVGVVRRPFRGGLSSASTAFGGSRQRRVVRRPFRGTASAAGTGDLLEFLDRGHHRPAGRVFQDPPQAPHTARALGVREPARGEHPGDLPVELRPVGDDDDGRLPLRLVAAQLEREP